MSIFVDETTKVVIQGISPTSQGLYHGLRNKAYGTKVVGGTNPKRGGEEIEGIPVFASVAEAVKETGATASFISVPPRAAADAIIEAADAGIAFIVCITEGIPAQDEAVAYNRLVEEFPGTRLLGPNCPGIISPGKCNIGITSGDIALAGGPVGIVSPLGHAHLPGPPRALPAGRRADHLCRHRRRPGPGHQLHRLPGRLRGRPRDQGGDDDRRDRRLRGGARGGVHRHQHDQAGGGLHRRRHRPPGRKMGHAGAIISGSQGTAQAKMEALSAAGVAVAQNPTECGEKMVAIVRGLA